MAKTSEKPKKTTQKKAKPVTSATKQKTTVKAVAASIDEVNTLSFFDLVKLWYDGWRQSFVFKGRSSRYEFCTFLLLNSVLMTVFQLICSYIMSPRFLRNAYEMGYSLQEIERYIFSAEFVFYLTIFVPLIPIGSLVVRRMHDLGKLAWNNFLEPVFMGAVVLWILFLTLYDMEHSSYPYTSLLLGTCFVTILYSVGYYGLKVFIMTMFYRGETKQNEFGAVCYNNDFYEKYALKFGCFYFLFIMTIGVLYLTLALL